MDKDQMAVTADPLPSMSLPVQMGVLDERSKRPKRKDALDAALLCSKLEAHKREQDAAQMRKEKREAVRNGRFVPRSAARSFAATTSTSMRDVANLAKSRRHQSDTVLFTAEPLTMDGKIRIPSEQLYAAQNGSRVSKADITSGKALGEKFNHTEPITKDISTNDSARPTTTQSEPRDISPAKSLKSHKSNKSLSAEVPTLAERRGSPKIPELVLSMRKRPEYARMPEKPISVNVEGWDKSEAEQRHSVPNERKDSIELERRRVSVKSEKRSSVKPESKRDSMNPAAVENNQKPQSRERSTSRCRRRSSENNFARVRATKPTSSSPDRGRPQYRPGDAAKRRSVMGPYTHVNHRPISFHTFQFKEARTSKFKETESPEGTIPELEELDPKARPKLAAHDRNDWCQRSQNGDDMRRTLHFLPGLEKILPILPEKKERSSRKSSAVEANGMAPLPKQAARKMSGPQNEHLIADAVAIIKQEKRVSRRESIFGLFKGL